MHPAPVIRPATVDDAAIVLRFIRELAAYEREPDAVRVTLEILREQLGAERPPFECVIAELAAEPVGFAVFFANYSTWRGRAGLHLEDLYVTPEARGAGVGKALLRHIAALAVARGCVRMEWSVLDWNAPAIGFYTSIGATPMGEWTVFRLADGALQAFAGG